MSEYGAVREVVLDGITPTSRRSTMGRFKDRYNGDRRLVADAILALIERYATTKLKAFDWVQAFALTGETLQMVIEARGGKLTLKRCYAEIHWLCGEVEGAPPPPVKLVREGAISGAPQGYLKDGVTPYTFATAPTFVLSDEDIERLAYADEEPAEESEDATELTLEVETRSSSQPSISAASPMSARPVETTAQIGLILALYEAMLARRSRPPPLDRLPYTVDNGRRPSRATRAALRPLKHG